MAAKTEAPKQRTKPTPVPEHPDMATTRQMWRLLAKRPSESRPLILTWLGAMVVSEQVKADAAKTNGQAS